MDSQNLATCWIRAKRRPPTCPPTRDEACTYTCVRKCPCISRFFQQCPKNNKNYNMYKKETMKNKRFWKTQKTVSQDPLRHGTHSFFNFFSKTQKLHDAPCGTASPDPLRHGKKTVSQDPLCVTGPPASRDCLRHGTPCVTGPPATRQ